MGKLINYLDRAFYPEVKNEWDNRGFSEFVISCLQPEHELLDFGAGRGRLDYMDFRDHCRRVKGVDVDPIVLETPLLHQSGVISLKDEKIPFADAEFDLVCSLNVLEHLTNPKQAFREVCRVLRSGGQQPAIP